jgi:CRP-like cAMP-binding protein
MLLNNPVLSTVALGDMAAQLEGMRLSLDDQILNPADKRLANSLLAMFGNRDVQTITIDATPTRLAEQIGATRQTVHRIIPLFLAKGILTKRGTERYNVYRGPLELFLDP